MPLTKYEFRYAASAFYEMDTSAARKILPKHLEPLELRHSRGVFAVTAFDFTGSMVGTYQEIVLAVISPPLMSQGDELPKSAFYPFAVGTSTKEARDHAIERWHLPHFMENVAIDFDETPERVDVKVHEDGKPIIDFSVNAHNWTTVNHLYQSFMTNGDDRFKANIHMAGEFSEHEEEIGEITIHDHPMSAPILNADIESYPFRELWMKNGVQTFQELETI